MPRLSLRADVVESTGSMRPVTYSIVGFTCGTAAYLTEYPTQTRPWLLCRSISGRPFERVGRFKTPAAGVEFLETWLSSGDIAIHHVH
jgi:hypothetical protein